MEEGYSKNLKFSKQTVKLIIALVVVILSLLTGYSIVEESDNTDQSNVQSVSDEQGVYEVIEVVDGDTISIELDGQEEKVRLIGIDTPETKKPNSPVECFGEEASEKIAELLTDEKVKIEFDESQGETDRYGRLLLYVWRERDNLFINEYMVKEGYANEYTYDLPYKYQEMFKADEKAARENKLGLWGEICSN